MKDILLFSNLSKYILKKPITIFSFIVMITVFFFYYAFISDKKLKVDFSLEQLFPNKDVDRDYYDNFKETYGREDNIIFLTFSNEDIFSDNNLTILETLTYELQNIDYIDYAFSLGILWDDGDGRIGFQLNKKERLDEIKKSSLYSGLLSSDTKSSLIVISINENVYNHETRQEILDQIDSKISSFNFNLLSYNNGIATFQNTNVLSDYSVGPYSALTSIIDDIDSYYKEIAYDSIYVNSINDCYQEVNADLSIDSKLTLEKIYNICTNPDLISEDLQQSKIMLSLEDNRNHNYYYPDCFEAKIEDVILSNEYVKFSDWEWHEAGLPVLRTRYVELVEHERMIFIPAAFLIAALTLVWIFRQFKTLLIALISILISLVWISGIMALFDISINVISYLVFNLLMVIGVSDAIHLLMKYHEEIYYNKKKKEALNKVIKKIGSALFLTSFTTAIGFLSLSITNVRILQEFGIIMGTGIFILFIITIIVMPIMLFYIKVPDYKHIRRLVLKRDKTFSFQILTTVQKHPKLIMSTSVAVVLISIYGITKIDSDVTVLGDLREGNKLYADINFVEDNFGGTLPLELVISAEKISNSQNVNLIDNPQFYNNINTFLNALINYDDIRSISGYWNLDGDINIQQYKYTNKSRNEIRVSCGIKNIDSEEAEILKKQIKQDYYRIFKNNNLNITGSTLLALKMNKYLISSLLSSFILAFIIIFISINILFKSFKLALVSMLPNIIPLLCAGGVMGFIGIELRPATAMTFSIALGIAVDDTIHFLSRFRSEFYNSKNHQKSTTTTILTTGRAIIGTTITLGMGFLVLIFSNFKPNYEFGILSTIILCIALLSSLVLLPSIINFIKPLNRSYETN